MKTLVVGAGGFVGSALVRALAAEGHDVCGLTRAPARTRARLGLDVEVPLVAGGLGDPASIASAARGCDVLFHAAGVADPEAPPRVLRWVHVAGTENVLRGARRCGVRRVVVVSCADVSLLAEDRMHWDEQRALPEAPLGEFARTKLMGEELALTASDGALEVTALRPAFLWGTGDFDGLSRLVREAERGGLPLYGAGRNILATTHIANLVSAALLAARAAQAASKAYYITDGEFLEAREVMSRLLGALGLEGRIQPRNLALAKAKAHARRLLGLTTDAELASIVRRGHSALFDLSRAAKDLGYQPQVDFERGMRELASWIAEHGGRAALLAQASGVPREADVDEQVERAGGEP